MRKVLLSLGLVAACLATRAQNAPVRSKTPIQKVVNLSEDAPDYDPQILTIQAMPSPGGDYKKNKAYVDALPRHNTGNRQYKAQGAAPEVALEFQGNTGGGTPNDNDMCIGNDGKIISVLNSSLRMIDSNGATLLSRSLAFFANSVGSLNRAFDPRTLYDPIHDRYIVVFLNGNESTTNNPVICFSQTNDPTGDWNCYLLPGNPFSDTSWSDYPIISISDQDLFLTLNLLEDDKGWQDGFRQSIIWQIDLASGYEGDSLDHNLWSDIKYDGKPIWSICPSQGGMKPSGPETYFLSVRPGDIQNDSLFVHTIKGSVKDGNATLQTKLFKTNKSYGLPPSAPQPDGQKMQTNDARVLTAMHQNGLIHFAGNTRDMNSNAAGIYYGVVDPNANAAANLQVLSYDTLDLGYPDIAYAGSGATNDHSVILTFSHVSPNTFPGTSVIYMNYSGIFSQLTRVKSGLRDVDVLLDSLERWGDYTGIQKAYNTHNTFWLAGSYGDRINRTTIAKIVNNDPQLSVQTEAISELSLFPNPSANYFQLVFELPAREHLSFKVYDMSGKLVTTLLEDRVKAGKNQFKFNSSMLLAGSYILAIEGQSTRVQRQFVVQP